MKKIIALLLFSPILFTNCDKDDKNEALYGIWIGVNISVFDCDNQNNNSNTNLSCTDTNCYQLEINSDGTYGFLQGTSGIEEGRWTRSELLSLCQEDDGEQICVEYIIDGNTSTTLTLSIINETNNCRRSVSFQRKEIWDQLNGVN